MSPKTILIVENHCDFLELLGKLFAFLGWDARLAKNAGEAWEQLQRASPSVILLDMLMEGMSGFDFARILKNHPAYTNVPILGTSALTDSVCRGRCLEAGCDDFISKPFAIHALLERLAFLMSAANQTKRVGHTKRVGT